MEAGVNIVAELQSAKKLSSAVMISKNPYVPMPSLNLIFARFDIELSEIRGLSRIRVFGNPLLNTGGLGYHQFIPQSFSSLEEAKNALDYESVATPFAFESVQQIFGEDSQYTYARFEPILKQARANSAGRLKRWSEALEILLRDPDQTFDEIAQESIHVLKLYRVLSGIFYASDIEDGLNERIWDNFYLEYEAILDHAADVIALSNKHSAKGTIRPNFSLGRGIVLPLYFIATKCRHPALRKRALGLLKSTHRQEGLLNSMTTGLVAQRVVQIEEEKLGKITSAEDIPAWARVTGVVVEFDPQKRRASITYVKHSKAGRKTEAAQEWLEWENSGLSDCSLVPEESDEDDGNRMPKFKIEDTCTWIKVKPYKESV
jgi:hypothetical protein